VSELRQTYDAITLGPYALSRSVNGVPMMQLTVRGNRVTGVQRPSPTDSLRPIDLTLASAAFVASASDIVPVAAGMRPGAVFVAPVWGPGMPQVEQRVFTVRGKVKTDVEGTMLEAWAVDEFVRATRRLVATWYLLDESPYMVAGDVPLPDGRMQRMTEVAVPPSTKP